MPYQDTFGVGKVSLSSLGDPGCGGIDHIYVSLAGVFVCTRYVSSVVIAPSWTHAGGDQMQI